MRLERHLEADAVKQPAAAFLEQRDARKLDIAFQRRHRDIGVLIGWLDDLRGLELLDHLVVLDLHVGPALLPVDQLLDRARQVLVGGDHRDQGADVEPAGQRQKAAAGIEDEGRELGEEVVEELHEELALVDLETDVEDASQARSQLGALVVGGVVGVNLAGALDDLADTAGELARGELALSPQPQDRHAQARDQDGLHQHDGAGDQPEPEGLHHDEDHGGDGLAAKEGGGDEGVADEAAQRLHLVLDHGGDLRRLHAPDLRQAEAQQPVGQLVAQAPQHALAHAALAGVDDVLEAAVDTDQEEEDEAEDQQGPLPVGRKAGKEHDALAGQRLAEGQANDADRIGAFRRLEAVALNALVDDLLRQVEREEIERQGTGNPGQKYQLLAAAVPPYIFEDVAFHAKPKWTQRPSRRTEAL